MILNFRHFISCTLDCAFLYLFCYSLVKKKRKKKYSAIARDNIEYRRWTFHIYPQLRLITEWSGFNNSGGNSEISVELISLLLRLTKTYVCSTNGQRAPEIYITRYRFGNFRSCTGLSATIDATANSTFKPSINEETLTDSRNLQFGVLELPPPPCPDTRIIFTIV